MSMFLIPKTNIERMEKIMKRFFWQGGSLKKKYHLVKWGKICKPKKKGGLGIKDLRKFNLSLLCKWWWKLEREEGMWQKIIKNKYMKGQCVSQIKHRPTDSPVWSDLLKVRDYYTQGRVLLIGNGKKSDFWRDKWCGNFSLCEKFKNLYEICYDRKVTVPEMGQRRWIMGFRRWLPENLQMELREMRDILVAVSLNNEKDRPKWLGEKMVSLQLSQYTIKCLCLKKTNQICIFGERKFH